MTKTTVFACSPIPCKEASGVLKQTAECRDGKLPIVKLKLLLRRLGAIYLKFKLEVVNNVGIVLKKVSAEMSHA